MQLRQSKARFAHFGHETIVHSSSGWGSLIAHCRVDCSQPHPRAMQLAACSATLIPGRPGAWLPASCSTLRCRARPRTIGVITRAAGGEQGPPPPAPPPPPPAEEQSGELQGAADKSLQLPPDVIQQLRTTVFRSAPPASSRCRVANRLAVPTPPRALLRLTMLALGPPPRCSFDTFFVTSVENYQAGGWATMVLCTGLQACPAAEVSLLSQSLLTPPLHFPACRRCAVQRQPARRPC